jgi:Raf kinase inhibitor-like YbhB/YbcL family protein
LTFYDFIKTKERIFLTMLRLMIAIIFIVSFTATNVNAGTFTLSSPTIKPDSFLSKEQVLDGFGCSGKNQSPALKWENTPEGTKSFAITVYDPDAPTGSGWWHWIVYNIPEHVKQLPAGAGKPTSNYLPPGTVQGRNDFGAHAFGGVCPPQGDAPHRYVFTVHALKIEKIDLPSDASAALIGFMINSNSLGKASITAKYSR